MITVCDLEASYHQFCVGVESRPYLAFTWKGVQYWFAKAPFGGRCLTSQFSRVMSSIVAEHNRDYGTQHSLVIVYVDDILIASQKVRLSLTNMQDA